MTATPTRVPVSPALLKAAEAAWAAYASTCRYGGNPEQRWFAYDQARAAERKVWLAEGSGAGKA